MNKIFFIEKSFLLLPLIFCLHTYSIELELKNNLIRARQAVWDVYISENFNSRKKPSKKSGIGFFIGKDIFITNLSSIQKAEQMEYIWLNYNNRYIKIKNIVALSSETDLVLLRTLTPSQHTLKLDSSPLPELTSTDKLFTISPPSSNQLSFLTYKFSKFVREKRIPVWQTYSNVFDIPSLPGKPLVNSKGNVEGFLFNTEQDIHKFYKASFIKSFLNKNINQNLMTHRNSFREVLDKERKEAIEKFTEDTTKFIYPEKTYLPEKKAIFSNLMIYLPTPVLFKLFSYKKINYNQNNFLDNFKPNDTVTADQFIFSLFNLADSGVQQAQILIGQIFLATHIPNQIKPILYDSNNYTTIRDNYIEQAYYWFNRSLEPEKNNSFTELAQHYILQMLIEGYLFHYVSIPKIQFRKLIIHMRTNYKRNLKTFLRLNLLYDTHRIPNDIEFKFEAKILNEENFQKVYDSVIDRLLNEQENFLKNYKLSYKKRKKLLQESQNLNISDQDFIKFAKQKNKASIKQKDGIQSCYLIFSLDDI